MLPIRTVLFATDFSEPARPAFDLACGLARDYGARLILTHVVAPARALAADGLAIPMPGEEPLEARAELAKWRPADERVNCEHRLLEGDPATKILELAAHEHVDILVMGTHGHTGLTRLLVGSVAETVVRSAPCPVLTVRGSLPARHADTIQA